MRLVPVERDGSMIIGVEEVSEIATSVWASLLERELYEAPVAGALPAAAQVAIDGAWTGRVRVETSVALARRLTSQMFDVPEDDVDDEMMSDAIGELANIIGGNVKALLPTPSKLGLPEPRGGAPAEVIAEAGLACEDEPVTVVVEKFPGPDDRPD